MHEAVYDGALTNPGEDIPVYDFTPDFQYISPVLQDSDLVIGNFEGTLAGPPYSGWPRFCGPDAMADALNTAGFDVLCTANNHCIDKGLDGLIRTATVLREKGFIVIGTRPDIDSSMDTVTEVDGIKIGLLNYTFETTGTAKRKALNGIPIPDGADPLICSFNPYRETSFDADLERLLLRVEVLRMQGADVICLVLHWGEEYVTHSSAWQREMAQKLCDGGVDLIIGHHPHVLQEIDVLTSMVTGKQTLVYYSLGNFLGNWAYGTLGTSGKAQDGMIARVTFLKTQDGVTIEKGEYIPTFVVRLHKGSELQHLIVPVLPASTDPSAYQTTEKDMLASYKRINKILGPCVGSAEIPVMEAAK
jgi:poly-gamma-glutamate synthesis protein (capsule biosynthesis protein)